MKPIYVIPPVSANAAAEERLCNMLLEMAGRDTNRLPSVIRHAGILSSAMPYMNDAQKAVARARLDRLQTKWGPLLAEDENEPETLRIPPKTLVVDWLSQRRQPRRHLAVMHLAAKAIWAGETSLSWILDKGYADQRDGLFPWVSDDTFKEWLLRLRVARREVKAVYRPGLLCRWWVEEMVPSSDRNSAFAACLKQLEQQRYSTTQVR